MGAVHASPLRGIFLVLLLAFLGTEAILLDQVHHERASMNHLSITKESKAILHVDSNGGVHMEENLAGGFMKSSSWAQFHVR